VAGTIPLLAERAR